MTNLSLGFSPCPNDTFLFHALVHGGVTVPHIGFNPRLEDVETLNQLALRGKLDVTKISYGVLPYVLDHYVLLRSGGALGRGCGPLVVARERRSNENFSDIRLAIPGRYTTANLLWRLFAPEAAPAIEMVYDEIMPAVAAGEVDAGLIIHESRFTYPDHGLVSLVDLGDWWVRQTGHPIPLGAIVAARSLGPVIPQIEVAIRRSVESAFRDPAASAGYVRQHAQEMSSDVTQRHIDLYVNDYSVDVGVDGEAAIRELLQRAEGAGLIREAIRDPFAPLLTT